MQTSLSVARDRVVGILVGLLMMWLVFDQLWSAPAAVEMKRTFIFNLRRLAELVRGPAPDEEKNWRSYSLRETISAKFDAVASLADGVLFELGSASRRQDLALRDRIRQWQPQLRMLLVTRIALLQYRLQLPAPIAAAQRELDSTFAVQLETMADRMEGRSSGGGVNVENGLARLERTVESYRPEDAKEIFTERIDALLSLDRRMQSLMISLTTE